MRDTTIHSREGWNGDWSLTTVRHSVAMTTMDDKNIDINNFVFFSERVGFPYRVRPSEMRTVHLRSLPCSTANEGQSRTLQLLQCDSSVLPYVEEGVCGHCWQLLCFCHLHRWISRRNGWRPHQTPGSDLLMWGRRVDLSTRHAWSWITSAEKALLPVGWEEGSSCGGVTAQHACCERCFKGTKRGGAAHQRDRSPHRQSQQGRPSVHVVAIGSMAFCYGQAGSSSLWGCRLEDNLGHKRRDCFCSLGLCNGFDVINTHGFGTLYGTYLTKEESNEPGWFWERCSSGALSIVG